MPFHPIRDRLAGVVDSIIGNRNKVFTEWTGNLSAEIVHILAEVFHPVFRIAMIASIAQCMGLLVANDLLFGKTELPAKISTVFDFLMNLAICFVIGLVIAAIATAIMKGQLKSVRSQAGASSYVKSGSLNVTHRQDLFLYRDVKRTAKPKDSGGSSTHTSSSGRSHGGGGGKF